MPALADLLNPADRRRLAALGTPPSTAELATAAREAAADSSGSGRIAWILAAHALDRSSTTAQAHDHLASTVVDNALRTLAIACLDALTTTRTTAQGTP